MYSLSLSFELVFVHICFPNILLSIVASILVIIGVLTKSLNTDFRIFIYHAVRFCHEYQRQLAIGKKNVNQSNVKSHYIVLRLGIIFSGIVFNRAVSTC